MTPRHPGQPHKGWKKANKRLRKTIAVKPAADQQARRDASFILYNKHQEPIGRVTYDNVGEDFDYEGFTDQQPSIQHIASTAGANQPPPPTTTLAQTAPNGGERSIAVENGDGPLNADDANLRA